jgi:hypothetical protein
MKKHRGMGSSIKNLDKLCKKCKKEDPHYKLTNGTCQKCMKIAQSSMPF